MTPAPTRPLTIDHRQQASRAAPGLDRRAARAHHATPPPAGNPRTATHPAVPAHQRAAVGRLPGNARHDTPPATDAGRRR
ncbi:hypothetical protein [Actinoplanes sp. ATCC 53533]|uniref:hypothetical protein n=1 Tax=Actinoplanes sp. ATCC 53533 TaxID=1288362 RepID=UPI000F78FC13|nr:hypothetical protein [Actinoplanes sp. ATCC 53533]